MRTLLIGASGTLGTAVAAALGEAGEVIAASRNGEHRVDLTEPDSITALYDAVGAVDAVVCTAGVTPYKSLAELERADFQAGLGDKLLGQVELVTRGIERVSDGGSFTLVSGILAYDPIVTGAVAAAVNGAVDAFVRAAAIELPRGLRINAVSATVFEEAWDAYGEFSPATGRCPPPTSRARSSSRYGAARPARSTASATSALRHEEERPAESWARVPLASPGTGGSNGCRRARICSATSSGASAASTTR